MTIYDLLDKHQHSLNRDQIRDVMEYERQRCLTTPGCTLFDVTKAVLKLQEFENLWIVEDNKAITKSMSVLNVIDPTTNPLKKKHGKHK